MPRLPKLSLALLLLAASRPDAPAQGSRHYQLADPSPSDRQAFPEARCIWRKDHAATMAFVHRLERGMPAREIMPFIDSMSRACGWRQRGARGDIVAAIVHLRASETDRCLSRAAQRDYRRFRATIDTRRSAAPAVERFIDEGFPAALAAAAGRCDPALVGPRGFEARAGFWSRLFEAR